MCCVYQNDRREKCENGSGLNRMFITEKGPGAYVEFVTWRAAY
jgi:hypothetical protein